MQSKYKFILVAALMFSATAHVTEAGARPVCRTVFIVEICTTMDGKTTCHKPPPRVVCHWQRD
jgi:hypothetical protein